MNPIARQVSSAFADTFGSPPPILVRAPGRVNLIGEHTDYNDGFVLPMAIDRAVWIALRPRTDRQVSLHSLDFGASLSFACDEPGTAERTWSDYIRGTAWALSQKGFPLQGWEGVMGSDVPIGAGLSSSAATEMVITRAFAAAAGWDWQPAQMAQVGNFAEKEWVGIQSGIMDQMVSAGAKKGHALWLDCRSLAVEHIPLPARLRVAVLDSSTRRGLVGSAYDERVQQCRSAARLLGAASLRDVDEETFARRQGELDEVTRQRARHVITENARVLQAVQALRRDRLEEFGLILNASHASLRDDYQVSSPALDQIVECALQAPGCLGVRMTGAGFGGCAVAVLRTYAAEAFSAHVMQAYRELSGLVANVYICTAEAGASVVV
jgi:galactokinase